jgi:hypothetical protein
MLLVGIIALFVAFLVVCWMYHGLRQRVDNEEARDERLNAICTRYHSGKIGIHQALAELKAEITGS